jgi:hypothetical protein
MLSNTRDKEERLLLGVKRFWTEYYSLKMTKRSQRIGIISTCLMKKSLEGTTNTFNTNHFMREQKIGWEWVK